MPARALVTAPVRRVSAAAVVGAVVRVAVAALRLAMAEFVAVAAPVTAPGSGWQPAYVGLGSNLDGPVERIERAFAQLAALPSTRLIARSALWLTPPVGPVAQPPFINAVAGLLTQLPPRALLEALLATEREQGRRREVRWGPRTLDLDLLVYGASVVDESGLQIPHPEMPHRAFVLYPLAEVAPALWVPGHGRVASLRAAVEGSGLERRG